VHETTVRFSDELWTRVQQASRREGISAAQFVREATLARIEIEGQVAGLRRDTAIALGRFEQRLRQIEEALRRHGLR
jgi:hypothetical protein